MTGQYKLGCMDNKDIPKMARELRAAFGLTQEQFAAKLGVPKGNKSFS